MYSFTNEFLGQSVSPDHTGKYSCIDVQLVLRQATRTAVLILSQPLALITALRQLSWNVRVELRAG